MCLFCANVFMCRAWVSEANFLFGPLKAEIRKCAVATFPPVKAVNHKGIGSGLQREIGTRMGIGCNCHKYLFLGAARYNILSGSKQGSIFFKPIEIEFTILINLKQFIFINHNSHNIRT